MFTVQLIYAFVFSYAKSRFSHDAAQIKNIMSNSQEKQPKLQPLKTLLTIDTIKFLNFRSPENLAVIYLKLKKEAKAMGISSKRCKLNSKQ